MKIIFCISFLFTLNSAISCTCVQLGEFSIKKEIKARDRIFAGTLIQIDTISVEFDEQNEFEEFLEVNNLETKEIYYTFLVNKTYKGKKSVQTIRVQSGIVGADDCKFIFELNKSYMVYANFKQKKGKKKYKKLLHTSVCTNTGILNEEKIKEIEK